jgi:hypothetical protein
MRANKCSINTGLAFSFKVFFVPDYSIDGSSGTNVASNVKKV